MYFMILAVSFSVPLPNDLRHGTSASLPKSTCFVVLPWLLTEVVLLQFLFRKEE